VRHVAEATEESDDEARVLCWLQQARRCIESLVTTTTRARVMLAGQAGQAAAVANIRSSALTLQECVTDCPCPRSAPADQLQLYVSRYRFICLEMESPPRGTNEGHRLAVLDRLADLNAELAAHLDGLQ